MTNLNDFETLCSCGIFKGIPEEECKVMFDSLNVTLREYSGGEVILDQGQTEDCFGVIKHGNVLSTKYHNDESAQVIRINHKGDVIGIMTASSKLDKSPVEYSAERFCSVLFVSYSELLKQCKDDVSMKLRITNNLFDIMANENIALMRKNDVLSRKTVEERVLTTLEMFSRKKNSNIINIHMTQDQFAQYLCVNRSTLSSALNNLRRKGKITYRGSIFQFTGSKNRTEQLDA